MSDNADKIGWIRNLFNEHPALLVSMLYVIASTIGMFYAWAFLSHFGINVFHYAAVSDFLLASLKDPITWVIVIAAMVLLMADNAMSRKVQQKTESVWLRWYGSDRYRFVNNFVVSFLIATFMYVFATWDAQAVQQGHGRFVQVVLADSPDVIRNRTLLGTTGQFLFVYDANSGMTTVYTFENVLSVSPLGSLVLED